jgi:hypothetical protein
VLLIIAAVVLIVGLTLGGVFLVRLSKSLNSRQRVGLFVMVILAVAYFGSRTIRTGMAGYRAGEQFRQQQGR